MGVGSSARGTHQCPCPCTRLSSPFLMIPLSLPLVCCRQGVPQGQTEGGGIVLAYAGARAPRGAVTRQGVVHTDLQSPLDCPKTSLCLSPPQRVWLHDVKQRHATAESPTPHTGRGVVDTGQFINFLLHNHFITEFFKKKKSGEAKDSAFFPFSILLHKRAKPILPPGRANSKPSPSARTQTLYSPLTLSLPPYPLPPPPRVEPLDQ
jgi:hypothetical protein